MASLEQYAAFIEIVDRGSLTAAARHLGRSLQSVSRALALLEDELGIALIRRTTRRMQPTAAGIAFHGRIKAALADIDLARAEASRESGRVSGLLRIAAPVLFAPRYVMPAVVTLLGRFPELEADMVLSDRVADLIDQRIDVAIRIGEPGAPSLMARRLTRLRRVMVAAPAYLAAHGRPLVPADLARHRCVIRTFGPDAGGAWPLTVDGRVTMVPICGGLRCNEAASANAALVLGAGLGMAPLWQLRADIDQGRLEVVLAEYEPPPVPVHAVWPAASVVPARTRLFIDMMVAHLAAERI